MLPLSSPELGTDLVAALASLNVDDLTAIGEQGDGGVSSNIAEDCPVKIEGRRRGLGCCTRCAGTHRIVAGYRGWVDNAGSGAATT
jgi:hypothetical protein